MIARILHEAKQCISKWRGVKVALIPTKMFSFFCLEEGDFTNDERATKEFEGESKLQSIFMEQKRGKDENGQYWKYN
jgi:hypothetical protein